MNKKGFTLIELLATLAILMVIFLLVFPSVKKILSSSNDVVYQSQINTILTAAYNWSLNNPSKLPDLNNKIYITLGELKYYNYIEGNVKNPETLEDIEEDLVVSITNVGSKYINNDVNAKKSGNYLFKAEMELINSTDYSVKKPQITLSDLTPNSDGNYVNIINQGEQYLEPLYTATSYNNIDLTEKVVVNMFYNDNITDVIDTNKIGIYYIKYTVIDSYGYANTVTNSLIISDTEAPVINLPSNNTISISEESFDLMDEVSCTDNSGYCNIELNGEVNFGVAGKYFIDYKAYDETGNTTTQRRVITVE